jgi:hypothetical protein
MADTVTTITNFINSPPGHLVAGGALAGIVWKFFDKVEEKLNDDTKLEIAIWLLSIKIIPAVKSRRLVLLNLFWAVCGKPESTKRMIVWVLLWLVNSVVTGLSIGIQNLPLKKGLIILCYSFVILIFLEISIRLTETALDRGYDTNTVLRSIGLVLGSATAGLISVILYSDLSLAKALASPNLLKAILRLSFIPALTVSMWMWMPVISGVLLKAARRIDIGVAWINRRIDERKALSTIGLVAGCLFALIYWSVAIWHFV